MKEVFNLFVENLTILDCAILHPQRGPIGMSWRVGIQFFGNLNKEGVVFDFSFAKKAAKKVIDSLADHAFIIPDTLLCRDLDNGPNCAITTEDFTYVAPHQAFFRVPQVTESSIIAALESAILAECKLNKDCAELVQVKLTLTEESEKGASYFNYSHGLKEHYGNCQRLVHGHRSTIQVFINNQRDTFYEQILADHYHDMHLVYWKNIVNLKDVVAEESDNHRLEIAYAASQGEFKLILPQKRCIIFPLETTIENISKYSAYYLKEKQVGRLDDKVVEVRAFEGIDKGCSYVLKADEGSPQELSKLWKEYDEALSLTPKNPELMKG